MSLKHYVSSFSNKVCDKKVSIELEVTKKALAHMKTPIYFPSFPGGPLIVNLFASRERLARAFGVDKSEVVDVLAKAVDSPTDVDVIESPPVLKNRIDDPDLRKFPIPKYYPGDGGRYITSGVVFAELDGKRNLSFHRMMLTGKNTFTIRLVERDLFKMYNTAMERGEEMYFSMAIGLCPSLLLPSATTVDYEVDEFKVASSLRKSTIGEKVEAARLDNGSLVPAHAEYLLEGRITHNNAPEGPFVDITGTYDHERMQPIVEIDRIWHSDNPIFHALLPGGHEHFLLMGLPRESAMKRELQQVVDVKDVRLTEGGCSWLHGVVSIVKEDDDDGYSAIETAFKAHRSMKKVIVVDDDIDIHDDRQVEWAVATRFQPDRDLVVLKGQRGSSLDPSSSIPGITAKWGLDATRSTNGFDHSLFTKAELE